MKTQVVRYTYTFKFKINWRIVWYSVMIWFLGFTVSAAVVLPWYYVASTALVFITTIFYFKILNPKVVKRGRKRQSDQDSMLAFGLGTAIAWFGIVSFLTLVEIAGFYYFDFLFYFSDSRNWFLNVLILIVPVVYALFLENSRLRGRKKTKVVSSKPRLSAGSL